jgi:hypothetical protein
VRVLLAALLVAGLLGGCGGGGKVEKANRYITAINEGQKRFAENVNRVSAGVTSKVTPAQERKLLGGYLRAVDEVVADMRAIHPPSRVRDLHARLAAAPLAFAGEIEVAQRELASRNSAKILDAMERVPRATTKLFREINGTLVAINRELGE